MKGRRMQSTAKRVDDAWKRCLRRRAQFSFLPMEPEECDWDTIKHTAAEMRSKIKMSAVVEHRSDLLLVRNALGRLPEV